MAILYSCANIFAILVRGLFQRAARDAIPELRSLLRDEDDGVRREAAFAATRVGVLSDESALVFANLVYHPTNKITNEIASAIGRLGPAGKKVVPQLIKRLNSLPEVRSEVRILGLIGMAAKDAVPELRSLARQSSREAMLALGRIGPAAWGAVPELKRNLGNKYTEVRLEAAISLSLIGPKASDAIPELRQLLGDEDPGVRASVGMALGRIGPAAVPALRTALKDRDVEVRWEAAEALVRIELDAAGSVAELGGAVLGDDAYRKGAELWGLREAATAESISEKCNILRNHGQLSPLPLLGGRGLREVATAERNAANRLIESLQALGRMGTIARGAIPDIQATLVDPNAITGLTDTNATIYVTAAEALVRMGEATVPELRKALGYSDGRVRYRVILALTWMGAPAVSGLRDALRDRDPRIRMGAIQSLGQLAMTGKDSIPDLLKALGDQEERVSLQASEALARMGPAAVLGLAEALSDQDVNIRINAARALSMMGPPSKDARRELEMAMNDRDKRVRDKACDAIREAGVVLSPVSR